MTGSHSLGVPPLTPLSGSTFKTRASPGQYLGIVKAITPAAGKPRSAGGVRRLEVALLSRQNEGRFGRHDGGRSQEVGQRGFERSRHCLLIFAKQ